MALGQQQAAVLPEDQRLNDQVVGPRLQRDAPRVEAVQRAALAVVKIPKFRHYTRRRIFSSRVPGSRSMGGSCGMT